MARINGVIILGLLCIVGWSFVTDKASETSAQEKQRTFVGMKTCKVCHTGTMAEKDVTKNSYDIWKDGPHSKTYEVLASDEAKAVAKERGIENPQEADECLKCHVTAHGVDEQYLGKKYAPEDGVGCESCHGAGKDYSKAKVKKAIKNGEVDPASVGLLKPDENTCRTCHNEESPTYKEFNFSERYEKIKHPIK